MLIELKVFIKRYYSMKKDKGYGTFYPGYIEDSSRYKTQSHIKLCTPEGTNIYCCTVAIAPSTGKIQNASIKANRKSYSHVIDQLTKVTEWEF